MIRLILWRLLMEQFSIITIQPDVVGSLSRDSHLPVPYLKLSIPLSFSPIVTQDCDYAERRKVQTLAHMSGVMIPCRGLTTVQSVYVDQAIAPQS